MAWAYLGSADVKFKLNQTIVDAGCTSPINLDVPRAEILREFKACFRREALQPLADSFDMDQYAKTEEGLAQMADLAQV